MASQPAAGNGIDPRLMSLIAAEPVAPAPNSTHDNPTTELGIDDYFVIAGDDDDDTDPTQQLTVEDATRLYDHILSEIRGLPGGADGVGVGDDDERENAITPAMAQRAAAILSILAARIRRGDRPEQPDEKLPAHSFHELASGAALLATADILETKHELPTDGTITSNNDNDVDDADDAEDLTTSVATPTGRTDETVIRSLTQLLPYHNYVSAQTHLLPKELLELVAQYCVELISIAEEFESAQEYVSAYPWWERTIAAYQRDNHPTRDAASRVQSSSSSDTKHESPLQRLRSLSSSPISSPPVIVPDLASFARALYHVAFYLRVGMNACQVDDDRASTLMLQAIELGYTPALAPMSRCFYYGKGVPKDVSRARELVMQGFEKDDPACIYYAAREYSNPAEKKARYARCIDDIEIRAKSNDLMYMFLWADCHQGGHGLAPSRTISLEWWRKMAVLGHSNAQNELAVALETGGHWSKDPAADAAEAFKWYSAGAAQNFRIAIRNLGDCYRDAFGCTRDREKASLLYARAYALGDHDAALRLRY